MVINLKVNKNTGAYACYSNDCFSNKTNRLLLYKYLGSLNRFNNNRFSYKNIVKEYAVPKLITNTVKLATVIKTPKVELIVKGNKQFTYYYHSNFQRLERIDFLDKSEKKKCFPQYYNKDIYNWCYGISDSFKPFCSQRFNESVHIVTEGAKNAYKVIQTGYSAFSFQQYNETEITKGLNLIKPSSIILLLDNDLVSLSKQNKIRDIAWKLDINTLTIDIKDLWILANITEDCTKGADIYDLLLIKPDIDLEALINKYISNLFK